jgi:hypothetical protein
MNISFRTHFPWLDADGQPKPTHFAQQIQNSLYQEPGQEPGQELQTFHEKLHTLRRLKGRRRFREGMDLVMTVGSRFKPLVFAEAKCTSTQLVHMELQPVDEYAGYNLLVDIDGQPLSQNQLRTLARNDGFPSPGMYVSRDFTRWFIMDLMQHGWCEYELVHWTPMRY